MKRVKTLAGVCAAALVAAPAISFAGASHILYQQKKAESSEISARADQAAPPQQVVQSEKQPQS